jgi:hypothetical protein
MTTTIAAEAGLSDEVLQAARAVVERYAAAFPVYSGTNPWAGCGVKNPPLLALLDQLIGAIEPVAAAIADNAFDDCLPVPAAGAKRLAEDLHRIADTITAAASAPST